ncbi:hypothetical protein [Brachyspira aalborgi]|uniref:Class I SAM-dependent methyltransferase n=1 Tax=Brachyspira aalborgi TaxID=29522 RepID=A0A5C8CC22_9SPIR|nr:hypothetical protein [Brachyspira aalborgi]TXJ11000.1 hypothetical protein EPJ80_11780 [Brachyspira aalborgi]
MNKFLEKLQIKLTPRFIRRIQRIENQININALTIQSIANKINRLSVNNENYYFQDHYEYWRAKRIVAIVEHYGENFFKGKKILELGCGYGDIGKVLISIGAEVIFCEGREEHINILKRRFPHNRNYKERKGKEQPNKLYIFYSLLSSKDRFSILFSMLSLSYFL